MTPFFIALIYFISRLLKRESIKHTKKIDSINDLYKVNCLATLKTKHSQLLESNYEICNDRLNQLSTSIKSIMQDLKLYSDTDLVYNYHYKLDYNTDQLTVTKL